MDALGRYGRCDHFAKHRRCLGMLLRPHCQAESTDRFGMRRNRRTFFAAEMYDDDTGGVEPRCNGQRFAATRYFSHRDHRIVAPLPDDAMTALIF
ncbi:hypothetical protein [Sphingopyxis flava]|uniref:Uncharacterized protein n=1 Tax=Sphingopyxis flava TaxID=1507287 RepID=A0A1T5B623_9SPHN|nr:hypothetical protein [Sphingopyxis flava]SKB42731.1 hypothetical protein SAMN06295937_1005197 [Sphingopyxis flava]